MEENISEIIKDNSTAGFNARSWKDFAALINGAWHAGAEAILDTAHFVYEASEELDRDVFEALLKSKLAFDASVGRKLKCIGENRVLCAHGHKLPACWTTIYELSKLDDEKLGAALADGKVHPKMMRKDAIALRKKVDPEDTAADTAEDAPTEPMPDELVELWDAATDAEKVAVLKHARAEGILELLKDDKDFLIDLYDRVLGLHINLATPVASSKVATNLLTNLTGTLHWTLGQDDPAKTVQGLTIIKAKLAVNKHDPKDICLAFVKKRR